MSRTMIVAVSLVSAWVSAVEGQVAKTAGSPSPKEYRLIQSVTAEVQTPFSTDRPHQILDLASVNDERHIVVSEGISTEPGSLSVVDRAKHWRISRFDTQAGVISLAALRNEVAATSWDSTLRIHECPSLKPRITIPIDRSASRVCVSPDRKVLGVVTEGYEFRDVSDGRSVSLYSVETGMLMKQLSRARDLFPGYSLTFSPDGRDVAVCGGVFEKPRGGIVVWDTVTGEKKIDVTVDAVLWKVAYTDDGKWLVGTGAAGTVVVNVATGKIEQMNPERGRTLSVLPSGKTVVIVSGDKLTVRKIPDLELVQTIPSGHGFVESMTTIDGGKGLLTANPSSIRIWNTTDWTSEPLVTGQVSINQGTSLVALPQTGLLAAANGRELRIFAASSGKQWNSKTMSSNIQQIVAHGTEGQLGMVLDDGSVAVLDVATGKILAEYPSSTASIAALSRDLKFAFSISADGQLNGKRLDRGLQQPVAKFGAAVTGMSITSNGAVCCGLANGNVVILNSDLSGVRASIPKAAQGPVTSLDWHDQDQHLVVGDEASVSLWNVGAPGIPRLLNRFDVPANVSKLAFSHDGDRVAAGLANGSVALISTTGAEVVLKTPTKLETPISSCVWLNGDRELATSSADGVLGRIKLKSRTLTPVHSLTAGEGVVLQSACLSPNGDRCFLAVGNKIEVRSTESWQVQQVLGGTRGAIKRLRMSPDGKRLAATGDDPYVQIHHQSGGDWDIDRTLFLPCPGYRLEWSPDGRWLIVGLPNPETCVVDTKSWEIVQKLTFPFIANAFSFSGDSRWMACAGFVGDDPTKNCKIQIWDTTTWKDPREFEGHKHGIEGVAMTPDGTRVYSTAADSHLLEWSLERSVPRKIRSLPMSGTSLSLLPNPNLAIASWHFGNLGIVDLTTAEIVTPFEAHSDGEKILMRDVVVSQNGEWAVSCAVSNLGHGIGSARLWRIAKWTKRDAQ